MRIIHQRSPGPGEIPGGYSGRRSAGQLNRADIRGEIFVSSGTTLLIIMVPLPLFDGWSRYLFGCALVDDTRPSSLNFETLLLMEACSDAHPYIPREGYGNVLVNRGRSRRHQAIRLSASLVGDCLLTNHSLFDRDFWLSAS
jgi:hypothetical protein